MQKILYSLLATTIYIAIVSCVISEDDHNSNADCDKQENAKIFAEKFAKKKLKRKYKNYKLVRVVEDASNFEFDYKVLDTNSDNIMKGAGLVITLSKSNCKTINYYILK
jgi:hypothetical protein